MEKLNVDCLYLIFNELTNKNSLYPFILVNKEWYNMAVPILCKKYSWNEMNEDLEKKLYNTILSCLPSSSKQLISENDIKLPSTKTPLFNYVSFCIFPNFMEVVSIVNMVLEEEFDPRNLKQIFLEQEIYKLFVSQ